MVWAVIFFISALWAAVISGVMFKKYEPSVTSFFLFASACLLFLGSVKVYMFGKGRPINIQKAEKNAVYQVVDQFVFRADKFIAAVEKDGETVRVFQVEDTLPSQATYFKAVETADGVIDPRPIFARTSVPSDSLVLIP